MRLWYNVLMDNNNKRGFLKLVLAIIGIIVILTYFGFGASDVSGWLFEIWIKYIEPIYSWLAEIVSRFFAR